jgi:hypothetical protein
MEDKDIKLGAFYRAKKPRKLFDGGYDDRKVLWISNDKRSVQYDSPTIGLGRHYPTVPIDKFLKWVGREITREAYISTSQKTVEA